MPDIQLRLNRDMLVMSTPIEHTLKAQGFSGLQDKIYVSLCEPELFEEAFKFESIVGTPCFVAPTDEITNACLAQARFEDRAQDMAENIYQAVSRFNPQHLIASVGPTGLPLDESSGSSLKQSRMQYQNAIKVLSKYPFDAMYFSGFTNAFDLQCALMGARAVYDGVVFASLELNDKGALAKNYLLGDAIAMACEYGADVVGIRSGLPIEELEPLVKTVKECSTKPLLVELIVNEPNSGQLNPTRDNPYYYPDSFIDVGLKLQQWGVQFVRGAGNATPSYTGALVAALSGKDVLL